MPAHLHLFQLLDVKVMVVPEPQPIMIASILEASGAQALKAPTLSELLDQEHEPYPYNKTFEAARLEPLLAFHTS
jgi:hypothetical protein